MLPLFEKYKSFRYFIYFTLLLKVLYISFNFIGSFDITFKTNYIEKKTLSLFLAYTHSIFIVLTSIILITYFNPFSKQGVYLGHNSRFLIFVYAFFVLFDHFLYSEEFKLVNNHINSVLYS